MKRDEFYNYLKIDKHFYNYIKFSKDINIDILVTYLTFLSGKNKRECKNFIKRNWNIIEHIRTVK